MDGYSPIKGKCNWWRETIDAEDLYNVRLRESQRRVHCSCFVEGKGWEHTVADVPADCPDARRCRYYIKNL